MWLSLCVMLMSNKNRSWIVSYDKEMQIINCGQIEESNSKEKAQQRIDWALRLYKGNNTFLKK